MNTFQTINPATSAPVATYTFSNAESLQRAVAQTHEAWLKWRATTFGERRTLMNGMADLLLSQKQELARLITTEMGKPIQQAIAEIEKCALVCTHYAAVSETLLQNKPVSTDSGESYIQFAPMGVVMAIMPWNFPFWQTFRFAAPALMAGNAALLKPAPNTSGCGLKIAELFAQAGFPFHLFTTVLADVPQIESLIAHPQVAAITLTGSTRAGRSVAALAGQHLKKTVLELGGSDPYVVLADADPKQAAAICVAGRLVNSGQSCVSAKRFIVQEHMANAFIAEVHRLLLSKKAGNPMDSESDLGPLARADLRDQLHQQVQRSVQAGATCELGGQIPEGPGFFYPPTLLTGVKKGMAAYKEELFGPVAVVINAKTEEEALAIANDTAYGLGSAIITSDVARARKIAEQSIQAGCCFINDFVKSDPRLPFGGIRDSGYGRELGEHGLMEFVNVKAIRIAR